MNSISRRARLDQMTPAELKIREAIGVVEEAGAHVLLTDAVNLLTQAQSKVADYVDIPKAIAGRLKLSTNFYLDELLVSSKADEMGIENTPLASHLVAMKTYLVPMLEQIRVLCGNRPITLTSAYRNPAVNKAVGGTATSAHPLGYAADIRVSGLSSLAVTRILAKAVKAGMLKVDQLIHESGRSIVHVSADPRYRMMVGHQPGAAGSPINWNYAP